MSISLRRRIKNLTSRKNPLKKWYYNPTEENFNLLEETDRLLDVEANLAETSFIEHSIELTSDSELQEVLSTIPKVVESGLVPLATGFSVGLPGLTLQTLAGLGGATFLAGGVYYSVKGATLPGSEHIGPKNVISKDISTGADEDARQHDIVYSKPDITEKEVLNADKKTIKDFGDHFADNPFDLHSIAGLTGLGIKHQVEKKIGVQYPKVARPYPGGRRKDLPENQPKSRTVTDTSTMSLKRKDTDEGYHTPSKKLTAEKVDNLDQAVDGGSSAPGAASGATSDISGVQLTVARPFWNKQHSSFTFNKVHRMLGFGLATTPITVSTIVNMVTNLMEIPWDKPFFYMTPKEYSLLPEGCFAKSVNISIVQRNPRVAFETTATMTDLATFNQNKFLHIAKGLNIKTYGNNKHIVMYDTTEPMKQMTIANANYTDLEDVLYGISETAGATFDSDVPALAFGVPYRTDNYWALRKPGSTYLGVVDQGWSDFMHHIEEYDMTAMSGTEILNESYTFKYAPLSLPHLSAVTWGTATAILTQPGLANSDAKIMTTSTITGLDNFAGGIGKTQTNSLVMNEFNHSFPNYNSGLMEQCYLYQGTHSGPHGCTVQPSIHVGVKPIPKLTTTTTDHKINTWTDVQSYFEINASINIEGSHPQMYPNLNRLNVSYDGASLRTSLNVNDTVPYTNGLPFLS